MSGAKNSKYQNYCNEVSFVKVRSSISCSLALNSNILLAVSYLMLNFPISVINCTHGNFTSGNRFNSGISV